MNDATRIRIRTWALWPALLAGSVFLASCAKKENAAVTPPTNNTGGPMGGPMGGAPQNVAALLPGDEKYAPAKKLYADNNCARCHKLGETGGGMMGKGGPPGGMGKGGPPDGMPGGMGKGGPPGGMGKGGPGGGSGPDLTHVGKEAEHTKEWLAEHIRDAKTHKALSKMPAFGPDKISDADLKVLADYLASRK